MFNRSAIMKRAWGILRDHFTIAGRFHRPADWKLAMSIALKKAWAEAKEAARIACIPVKDRQARIAALQGRIAMLSYRPIGHCIQTERRDLERQIAALAA